MGISQHELEEKARVALERIIDSGSDEERLVAIALVPMFRKEEASGYGIPVSELSDSFREVADDIVKAIEARKVGD